MGFELWSLPVEKELKTLKVTNLTSQPQTLWVNEINYQVPAFANYDLPLIEFSELQWLPLKAQANQIFQIQIETSFETLSLLRSGSQTRWKVRARPQSELVIYNPAPFTQKVQLTTASGFLESHSLTGFGKKRLKISPTLTGELITLSGQVRIGGFLISSADSQSLIPDPKPVVLNPRPELAYFRLTNADKTQSYIVGLDNPDLISQARKQIQYPNAFLPRILLGRVGFGHGELNRDFSSPAKSPWSWHLTEVFRFAELASQECDGSPQMLEERLYSWTQGSGVICFWSYRIVEELSLSQVAQGR